MIGCLPTQALAFLAVFVYATQVIAFEWKQGLTLYVSEARRAGGLAACNRQSSRELFNVLPNRTVGLSHRQFFFEGPCYFQTAYPVNHSGHRADALVKRPLATAVHCSLQHEQRCRFNHKAIDFSEEIYRPPLASFSCTGLSL